MNFNFYTTASTPSLTFVNNGTNKANFLNWTGNIITTTHIIWLLPKYNFLMRHSELVMLWSTKSVWSLQYGPNHLLTPLFVSVYKCRMISIIHQFGALIHGWKLSNIFIIILVPKNKEKNHWINFLQIHDNLVLPRF